MGFSADYGLSYSDWAIAFRPAARVPEGNSPEQHAVWGKASLKPIVHRNVETEGLGMHTVRLVRDVNELGKGSIWNKKGSSGRIDNTEQVHIHMATYIWQVVTSMETPIGLILPAVKRRCSHGCNVLLEKSGGS